MKQCRSRIRIIYCIFVLLMLCEAQFDVRLKAFLKASTSDWRILLLINTLPTCSKPTRVVGNELSIPYCPREKESWWNTDDSALIHTIEFRKSISFRNVLGLSWFKIKERIFGIASCMPPHMPPLMAYLECDGWSLITWNFFSDSIQLSTADFSRRDNRESISRITYLSTFTSEAIKKRYDILFLIHLLDISMIVAYLYVFNISIIFRGTVIS